MAETILVAKDDPRFQVVYKDKSKQEYYGITQGANYPWKRFATANIHDFFIKKGLPDTFLKKIIELGKQIALDTKRNEKKLREDVFAIFQNLEMRLGYVCGEEQYLRLAAAYFLLPDEPVAEVYESFTQRKMQLWEADQKAKDFFLQWAFERTMGLVDISLEDIQNYLRIAQEREMTIPTLPEA